MLPLWVPRLCIDAAILLIAKEICCFKHSVEKMVPHAIPKRSLSLLTFLNPVGALEDIAYINITANIVFC